MTAAASTAARERLGAAQAELVAALLLGAPVPAGLPADRVRATARGLVHKRADAVATHWPLLAHALGPRFVPALAEALAGTAPGGGPADGWRLARALHRAGALPAEAFGELLAAEAAYRFGGGDGSERPRPRRGVTVRAGRYLGRSTVAVRVGRRVRWFG